MPISLRAFVQHMNDANLIEQEFTAARLKELAQMPANIDLQLGFALEHIPSSLANVAAGRRGEAWVEKVPGKTVKYRWIGGQSVAAHNVLLKKTQAQNKSKSTLVVPEQWTVNTGHVPRFIEWVVNKEKGNKFDFNYSLNGNSLGEKTIEGAALRYKWETTTTIPSDLTDHIKGFPDTSTSLEDTVKLLMLLRKELRESIEANDPDRHLKACWATLYWGGVANRGNLLFYTFFQSRPIENKLDGLLAYHRAAHIPGGWFDPATTDEKALLNKVKGMSAGITKIHSLLADELLIYDSRVACAVAWLVERYCDDNKLTVVPDELNFSLPEERPGQAIRNPEKIRKQIGSELAGRNVRPQGVQRWTRDMLRASLILSAILIGLDKTRIINGHTLADTDLFLTYQLGLFMIGYNLADHRVMK